MIVYNTIQILIEDDNGFPAAFASSKTLVRRLILSFCLLLVIVSVFLAREVGEEQIRSFSMFVGLGLSLSLSKRNERDDTESRPVSLGVG